MIRLYTNISGIPGIPELKRAAPGTFWAGIPGFSIFLISRHVLADAARRDPSIGFQICLDGRKDLVEITLPVKTSTARKYF